MLNIDWTITDVAMPSVTMEVDAFHSRAVRVVSGAFVAAPDNYATVAPGAPAVVLVSTDGEAWTEVNTGVVNALSYAQQCVVSLNNGAAVVSCNGVHAYSEDGTVWTPCSALAATAKWTGSRYIRVLNATTVEASADRINVTAYSNPAGTASGSSHILNGRLYFLPYSGTTGWWTTDGATWNSFAMPSAGNWYHSAYNASNDTYLIAKANTSVGMRSVGGSTFAEQTMPSTVFGALYCIDGVFYQTPSVWNIVSRSTDGANWNNAALGGYGAWGALAKVGGALVLLGTDRWFSRSVDNGLTWAHAQAETHFLREFIPGDVTRSGSAKTVDEGASWSCASVMRDVPITSGGWAGAQRYGFAYSWRNNRRVSAFALLTNGTVTHSVTLPDAVAKTFFDQESYGYAAAHGGGRWVIPVQYNGSNSIDYCWTSTDTVTWELRQMGTANTAFGYRNIAYGNGRFVAVSTEGASCTSTDGLYWTSASGVTPANTYGVTFFGGSFYIETIGYASETLVTTNGLAWSTSTTHYIECGPSSNGMRHLIARYGGTLVNDGWHFVRESSYGNAVPTSSLLNLFNHGKSAFLGDAGGVCLYRNPISGRVYGFDPRDGFGEVGHSPSVTLAGVDPNRGFVPPYLVGEHIVMECDGKRYTGAITRGTGQLTHLPLASPHYGDVYSTSSEWALAFVFNSDTDVLVPWRTHDGIAYAPADPVPYQSWPYPVWGEGPRLVVTDESTPGGVFHSKDGTDWQHVELPPGGAPGYGVYFNGRYVVLTWGGEGFYTSTDGAEWVFRAWAQPMRSHYIVNLGDVIVIRGQLGYAKSFDGIEWTFHSTPAGLGSYNIGRFADGRFFLFGNASQGGARMMFESTDAEAWQPVGVAAVDYVYAFCAGGALAGDQGGGYLAAGSEFVPFLPVGNEFQMWTATLFKGKVLINNCYQNSWVAGATGAFSSEMAALDAASFFQLSSFWTGLINCEVVT